MKTRAKRKQSQGKKSRRKKTEVSSRKTRRGNETLKRGLGGDGAADLGKGAAEAGEKEKPAKKKRPACVLGRSLWLRCTDCERMRM